jgi:hypothetical protein
VGAPAGQPAVAGKSRARPHITAGADECCMRHGRENVRAADHGAIVAYQVKQLYVADDDATGDHDLPSLEPAKLYS